MRSHPIRQIIKKRKQSLLDFVFILAGSLVLALAMRLFLIPALLVSTVWNPVWSCRARIRRSVGGHALTGGRSSSQGIPAAHRCASAVR